MLQTTFKKARLSAPSIVFLDEIDALFAKRSASSSGDTSDSSLRLLSVLLTEMDGMELATGWLLVSDLF